MVRTMNRAKRGGTNAMLPEPWDGEAFNPVPDSENRIHSDEVAREYGFRGGLVPGVVVAAYANPAYMLGITNWALAGNVKISPWLHLQTDSQNYAPIPPGSELVAEVAIRDLFEKKGHEFVDLDVAVYFEATRSAVMRARLRAIYKMRGV